MVEALRSYGGRRTTHSSATKWHIDEAEQLHIIGPNGNIASYNRGYWANVHHTGTEAPRITAVATLYSKADAGNGQTTLEFSADYADEPNKAWAKYTPGLGVQMTVIDPVAEQFEKGGRYLLTFEKQD